MNYNKLSEQLITTHRKVINLLHCINSNITVYFYKYVISESISDMFRSILLYTNICIQDSLLMAVNYSTATLNISFVMSEKRKTLLFSNCYLGNYIKKVFLQKIILHSHDYVKVIHNEFNL